MAISKQKKTELLDQYKKWLETSQAVVLTGYTGLTVKDLDELRRNLREAGGEFHIVKNTLGKIAFQQAGLEIKDEFFEGSTAVAFAFEDPPGLAKALADFAKGSDFVKIKGGYLADKLMEAEEIKFLADLPPLPVIRAQLLGVINAPASKLVRVLAEPGRQIAAVLQAYADKDAATASA